MSVKFGGGVRVTGWKPSIGKKNEPVTPHTNIIASPWLSYITIEFLKKKESIYIWRKVRFTFYLYWEPGQGPDTVSRTRQWDLLSAGRTSWVALGRKPSGGCAERRDEGGPRLRRPDNRRMMDVSGVPHYCQCTVLPLCGRVGTQYGTRTHTSTGFLWSFYNRAR